MMKLMLRLVELPETYSTLHR